MIFQLPERRLRFIEQWTDLTITGGLGEYGDYCLFQIHGEPTELTLHICVNNTGKLVHYAIHGFRISEEESCIDFKKEFKVEIDAFTGRKLPITKTQPSKNKNY